jgi:hypothetical protein
MVRELVADGVTVLLTTQYLDEAVPLAERITVIDHGRVVAEGRPDELKRRIGGQTLQVRPTLPSDMDPVAAILAELTGAAPVRDEDVGLLAAPVSDPCCCRFWCGGSTRPASPRMNWHCGCPAWTRCSSRSPDTQRKNHGWKEAWRDHHQY